LTATSHTSSRFFVNSIIPKRLRVDKRKLKKISGLAGNGRVLFYLIDKKGCWLEE
jgi:hypothetical protein